MKKFWEKLKTADIRDVGHIFLFLLAIVPAFFMRRKRKDMWLVSEYRMEARDNGYWFYRYMRRKHPERDVVYAIDFASPDYARVRRLGECVNYGTLRHWIYYLCARVNISSQKSGKPNAAVCYVLEVYGLLKNKRVFLQHGITKDDAEMFYYDNTKMRLFICGAKPEYEFIKEKFGYPEGYVAYTGFPRFDNLLRPDRKTERLILAAPTWRRWLYQTSSDPYENRLSHIEHTEYYRKWTEFLQSERLRELLERYDYKLVFFPHRNMTESFASGKRISDRVRCATWKDADIQQLMMKAACMITDYSSTAMDFAYMKKPLLYYQFDEAEYREKHFKKGYFDYARNGFGEVCAECGNLMDNLEQILENGAQMTPKYLARVEDFFVLRDRNNCKRIYEQIMRL